VCRAFAAAYVAEGIQAADRDAGGPLLRPPPQAYPIHPEVFDRLYEDWTTIDGFQRTRGVLKLMAKVIYRLWKDENKDLMILPGSLPLYDSSARNELTYYLSAGWDAVLEKDIDGERAETTELDTASRASAPVNAARRVARTIFLGSAPVVGPHTKKGIPRRRPRPRPAWLPAARADGRVTPMPSTAWPTGCTTSTAPATRRRTRRASGSTPAPTCAARWRTASAVRRPQRGAREDRRGAQEALRRCVAVRWRPRLHAPRPMGA
jgi:hypothetical protein